MYYEIPVWKKRTFRYLVWPVFEKAAIVATFFVIANVFFLIFHSNADLTLTPWSMGFILASVSLACTTLVLLERLLQAYLLSTSSTPEPTYFEYKESNSHTRRLGIYSIAFALGFAYFRGADKFFSGVYWLLPALILVNILNIWFTIAPKTLGYKREVIEGAEFEELIGKTEAQRVASPTSHNEPGKPVEAIASVSVPRQGFKSIYGMSELKRRLLEAGAPVFAKRPAPDDVPRNGILLFGSPGNGKTAIAEALAGELGVKFLVLDYSKAVSQWVGETSKNVSAAFSQARKAGRCVLFIDEIDSFIVNRDGPGQSTAESANLVNLLLTELVNIRKYPVLVVAATNRLSKLDGAAIREGRFDFKIEITPPDAEARLGLLKATLAKHVKNVPVSSEAVQSMADRWEGFSVKRILAVGEEMPSYLREHPATEIGFEQLSGALRAIQGRKGAIPLNTKPLSELVLPPETRQAVDLIAKRIADPMRIERLGGTLPNGILFHGAAGTGKTAVARALAKETGWAFLSVAGPDLMRDLDMFESLYAEAKDIRPCLVFIDEADDILRDRSYSNASALTNKMLTIMDGAGGRVKDVIFIAATNNPDQIDPAMLRAGRFTEKVPFFNATEQSALQIADLWMKGRKVSLANGVGLTMLGRLLEGQSPANIEGILQYALNLAIDSHTGGEVTITLDQIAKGMSVVAPA